jgi:hypothetical protein
VGAAFFEKLADDVGVALVFFHGGFYACGHGRLGVGMARAFDGPGEDALGRKGCSGRSIAESLGVPCVVSSVAFGTMTGQSVSSLSGIRCSVPSH